jgi:hypothetical protein
MVSVLSATNPSPKPPVGITITSFGGHWVVLTQWIIVCCCILIAIARFIANIYTLRNRVLHRAVERLERYDGKLSRTVFRGLEGSNALWLPDPDTPQPGYASPTSISFRLI